MTHETTRWVVETTFKKLVREGKRLQRDEKTFLSNHTELSQQEVREAKRKLGERREAYERQKSDLLISAKAAGIEIKI